MAEQIDWPNKAACKDEDPELFFAIYPKSKQGLAQIEEARAVCNRCPVIDECLRWALETGQDAGVWGGMSEDERRAIKRRQNRLKDVGKASIIESRESTTYHSDGDF
jgi:WhiB family redox-sensing transcriptional regulator